MRDDVEQAADFGLENEPFLGHCCFTFGISLASESGWVRKLCQICEMPRKAATLSVGRKHGCGLLSFGTSLIPPVLSHYGSCNAAPEAQCSQHERSILWRSLSAP